jgi:microcystin-dependent protein
MNPYIGEIRPLAFNFAPVGWAMCNGQLLPISQNTALFSILGTMYGGDGKSTFALPNLQGQIPVHRGQAPGFAEYDQGQTSGLAQVGLLASEMPAHSHAVNVHSSDVGDSIAPGNNTMRLASSDGGKLYHAAASGPAQLGPQSISPTGGNQPHNNLMPYLTINFCIALVGVFPPRQ